MSTGQNFRCFVCGIGENRSGINKLFKTLVQESNFQNPISTRIVSIVPFDATSRVRVIQTNKFTTSAVY